MAFGVKRSLKTQVLLPLQLWYIFHRLQSQQDNFLHRPQLSCLSSVLRQLMVFHTDLHRFVTSLRVKLGPQIQTIPLLYQGAPELKDVLALFDITIDSPQESLPTAESRARFQSLMQTIFSVIAETRLFALFLDDIQDADEPLVIQSL